MSWFGSWWIVLKEKALVRWANKFDEAQWGKICASRFRLCCLCPTAWETWPQVPSCLTYPLTSHIPSDLRVSRIGCHRENRKAASLGSWPRRVKEFHTFCKTAPGKTQLSDWTHRPWTHRPRLRYCKRQNGQLWPGFCYLISQVRHLQDQSFMRWKGWGYMQTTLARAVLSPRSVPSSWLFPVSAKHLLWPYGGRGSRPNSTHRWLSLVFGYMCNGDCLQVSWVNPVRVSLPTWQSFQWCTSVNTLPCAGGGTALI